MSKTLCMTELQWCGIKLHLHYHDFGDEKMLTNVVLDGVVVNGLLPDVYWDEIQECMEDQLARGIIRRIN